MRVLLLTIEATAQDKEKFAHAQQQNNKSSSVTDPRADETLREMSSLLAQTSSFAFKAELTFDEILGSGLNGGNRPSDRPL